MCRAGRRNKAHPEQDPHIPLAGVGIGEKHAIIETSENGSFLSAASAVACPYIHINGEKLQDTKPVKLRPNDRIIFGSSSFFLFRHTAKASEESMSDNPEITHEFASQERLEKEMGGKLDSLK